jgi:hypothetical protein
MHQGQYMRGKAIFALLVTIFMMTPVQAGEVNTFQTQQNNPEQPDANNTTLYAYSDGINNFWSHFSDNDTDSVETFTEEDDNGVITIKHRYTMTPVLDKRLSMTVGGEIRGNFNIYYNGDSDSTDNAGPCQPSQTPNDCDWLNITMYKGQTKVFQHTENPWPADQWKNIQFSFFVEEGNETWDANNDNPIIEVTMKIKGDYQEGFGGLTVSGTPGAYGIELGESSSVQLPIDPASFDDVFQDGGNIGDAPASEDTPGFSLVVASAAIAMAAFINQRRDTPEQE